MHSKLAKIRKQDNVQRQCGLRSCRKFQVLLEEIHISVVILVTSWTVLSQIKELHPQGPCNPFLGYIHSRDSGPCGNVALFAIGKN